jgi:ribosome-associated heat shock protein Hsp15
LDGGVESASVRVDQWLWAIRLYKTRSAAQDGCRGGHVKVNGAAAKPATPVHVGDRVEARVHDWARDVEVTRLITKRVGAAVAVECYVDHSPPPPERNFLPRLFPRAAGAGRPTKRDRRRMDDLRKG